MKSIAVIGASLAGLSAARALRAQGFDGDLTVVGGEERRPYDRPPLSKEFLTGDIGEDALALEADDDDLNAEWLLGVHATHLDANTADVQLDDGTTVHADGIVLATGARARTWPGAEGLAGVHVLRTIDDAVALRDELRPGARLVVIGAGFIGAEVASTAAKLGLDVTVVEAALAPLAGPLGVQLGAAVARLHTEHGTRLLCGAPVAGLLGTDRVTGIELADGRRIAADVVLVGIGAVPNVEWLRDSPVE
ncbi:MAG TPA: NAD(P)/FAD-dependent oxidoreductase, partial [Mycobacterium sp.]|nr:NAD(P)/FAD-dependent oxidoreductase [Mycobacterium sp.]